MDKRTQFKRRTIMSEKMAKGIFWVGTLVSLILFLALTVDTHNQFDVLTHADQLNDQVVSGKRAFQHYNCNDCHTILGFGGYYAPDLTRAYNRLGEDSIRRILKNPEVVFADSYRKMPQQNLKDQEIEDLVAYLKWVANIDNSDWPPHHSEERWKRSYRRLLASTELSPGAALIKQKDCLTCHMVGDQGERLGPRLEWIAEKRDVKWIAEYIKDPQAFAKGTDMPAYGDDELSKEDRRKIAEFIVSLKGAQDRTRGGE
jgi:nitric oxide reductase subunit C